MNNKYTITITITETRKTLWKTKTAKRCKAIDVNSLDELRNTVHELIANGHDANDVHIYTADWYYIGTGSTANILKEA